MSRKTKKQLEQEEMIRRQAEEAIFCENYQTRLIKILARIAEDSNIPATVKLNDDHIDISISDYKKNVPISLIYKEDSIKSIELHIINVEDEIDHYYRKKEEELAKYLKLQNAKAKLTEEELQLLTENIKSTNSLYDRY